MSIDRINPQLTGIRAIHEHQINLYFSEEIDTTKIEKGDITISCGSKTLDIYTLYPGNSPAELFLTTENLKDTIYEIKGRIFDKSQREGIFIKRFRGSIKKDTISPWIRDYAKGLKNKYFYLLFSEPVDTNSLEFFIIPKKELMPEWRNLRYLFLKPNSECDSLNFDTTYYLFLKNISDFSGNRFGPFITSITPDTSYQPQYLKGKALVNDTLLKDGYALLEKERPIAITSVDKGEFIFEVRDSFNYFVRIFTKGYYGADSVATRKENIIKLEGFEVNLDSLIN